MRWLIISLALTFVCLGCKEAPKQDVKESVQGLVAEKAIVVSARKEASEIGVQILKKGGNAFDAMVATEMALAVTYPYAGNLGGGGFMVYRTQFGEIGTLDFREKAPLKAHRDMYLDEDGNYLTKESKYGGLAVAVPGTIAGIFAVHEKFGSLPIEEILTPVVALARRGFVVTQFQVERLLKYRPFMEEVNQRNSIYTMDYKQGDTLKNDALANTIQRIITNGKSEFYEGQTAQSLVDFIQANGGIITLDDLAAYEVAWREPLIFSYKDLNLISMAPPSSGGSCLAQILKMIEPYDLRSFEHQSLKSIQVIAEAERRAYADRSHFLGDPDFVEIPLDSLLIHIIYRNE